MLKSVRKWKIYISSFHLSHCAPSRSLVHSDTRLTMVAVNIKGIQSLRFSEISSENARNGPYTLGTRSRMFWGVPICVPYHIASLQTIRATWETNRATFATNLRIYLRYLRQYLRLPQISSDSHWTAGTTSPKWWKLVWDVSNSIPHVYQPTGHRRNTTERWFDEVLLLLGKCHFSTHRCWRKASAKAGARQEEACHSDGG